MTSSDRQIAAEPPEAEPDVCPSAQTNSALRDKSHLDKASGSVTAAPSAQTLPDDGHTIADMSALDGLSQSGQSSRAGTSRRDVREELGDSESRRALIFAATWAGLSIGLVYIIIFGLIIALMLLLWR